VWAGAADYHDDRASCATAAERDADADRARARRAGPARADEPASGGYDETDETAACAIDAAGRW